jgi:hypothetical protein
MRNTADVTGGKPIVVGLGVRALNPLTVFYNIHRRKGEVFFCFVSDTTRDNIILNAILEIQCFFATAQ